MNAPYRPAWAGRLPVVRSLFRLLPQETRVLLKPGPVATQNALRLMKLIGIAVEIPELG